MTTLVVINHTSADYNKSFNYHLKEKLLKSGFKVAKYYETPEMVVHVAPVSASSGSRYANRITLNLLESQPVVQVLLPEDDIAEPRWTGMVHDATDRIVAQLRLLHLKG